MRGALLACLAAACLLMGGNASAQGTSPAAPATGCPATASDMPLEALFGTWEARFEGLPGVAKVQLAKHPDYAGVRGTITRSGGDAPSSTAQLAGDVDEDGDLSLDESMDGRSISGVWLGQLQAASCGKEFKGIWRNAADESTHPFVLTKINDNTGK
ncbi:hypothetical protein [Variovorax sp. YR216]|uniref:hypothetical protein n=1 Tax=Variovorax sp. YR216 TaxID=1882828 RepID=UPI00089A7E20|nr:hypothetical protein [Variovorax sp. YR216]SEB26209.1 hypothetical protein SAMN05444680_13019 [Variovorax sp. YR216]